MGYSTIGLIQLCLVVLLFISLPLWKKAGAGHESLEGTSQSRKFIDLIRIPGAKPAILTFFSYCALEAAAGLWGSSYLVISRGISANTAAKWISLYYFGITLGRFLSGFVTIKLGNRTLVRLGQGIIIVGLLCILLPVVNNYILMMGFLLVGLGCAPIFPCAVHETPERFGKDLSQAFIGIQMAFAYMGSTLMPPILGFIAQKTTFAVYPYFLLIFLIVMFLSNEKTNSSAYTR